MFLAKYLHFRNLKYHFSIFHFNLYLIWCFRVYFLILNLLKFGHFINFKLSFLELVTFLFFIKVIISSTLIFHFFFIIFPSLIFFWVHSFLLFIILFFGLFIISLLTFLFLYPLIFISLSDLLVIVKFLI